MSEHSEFLKAIQQQLEVKYAEQANEQSKRDEVDARLAQIRVDISALETLAKSYGTPDESITSPVVVSVAPAGGREGSVPNAVMTIMGANLGTTFTVHDMVAQVGALLGDRPTVDTVRVALRRLADKGRITKTDAGFVLERGH